VFFETRRGGELHHARVDATIKDAQLSGSEGNLTSPNQGSGELERSDKTEHKNDLHKDKVYERDDSDRHQLKQGNEVKIPEKDSSETSGSNENVAVSKMEIAE